MARFLNGNSKSESQVVGCPWSVVRGPWSVASCQLHRLLERRSVTKTKRSTGKEL